MDLHRSYRIEEIFGSMPDLQRPDKLSGGFDKYLASASQMQMDVNDWLETELGWYASIPVMEKMVIPYLREDSIVCELGPGTGRFSRHFPLKVHKGELHLFDHSPWIQSFLKYYFSSQPNVFIYDCDGKTINMPDDSVDLVFSNGMFTTLKLGELYLYAMECKRVLKHGGYLIFNYVDISTEAGWKFLESQPKKLANCFSFHCEPTIDRLFKNLHFSVLDRSKKRSYVFIVLKLA